MKTFLTKLEEFEKGEHMPWTLELDDPMQNCFVYNPFAPKADPQIYEEEYERTFEQNEDIGVNDMKTDD